MSMSLTISGKRGWLLASSVLGMLLLAMAVGVAIGLRTSSLVPEREVHAVATHGVENFAICTGPMDDSVEAIFFLDFLTGDLKAAALNINTHTFTALYHRNILNDLENAEVKNPRYLMVTGTADLRRGASATQIGQSVVYVAEITSGQVMAYGLPWVPSRQARVQPSKLPIVPIDKIEFRTVKKRPT